MMVTDAERDGKSLVEVVRCVRKLKSQLFELECTLDQLQLTDRSLVFEREGVSRLQLRSPIIAIRLLAASARSHTVNKLSKKFDCDGRR